MPDTSSGWRTRGEEVLVGLGSQARKRGQARVQDVQPFWPWTQSSGPSSSSRWNGL